MANKYMKKCSTSLSHKGNANKNNSETPSHHSQNQKKTTIILGEDVGL
jgi:hypothetical protein